MPRDQPRKKGEGEYAGQHQQREAVATDGFCPYCDLCRKDRDTSLQAHMTASERSNIIYRCVGCQKRSCNYVILKNHLGKCGAYKAEQLRPGSRWGAFIGDEKRDGEAARRMTEPKRPVPSQVNYAPPPPAVNQPFFGTTNRGALPTMQMPTGYNPFRPYGPHFASSQAPIPSQLAATPAFDPVPAAGQHAQPGSTRADPIVVGSWQPPISHPLATAPIFRSRQPSQPGSSRENPFLIPSSAPDPVTQLMETAAHTFDLRERREVNSLLRLIASHVGYDASNHPPSAAGGERDTMNPPLGEEHGGTTQSGEIRGAGYSMMVGDEFDFQLFDYASPPPAGLDIGRALRRPSDLAADMPSDPPTFPTPRIRKRILESDDAANLQPSKKSKTTTKKTRKLKRAEEDSNAAQAPPPGDRHDEALFGQEEEEADYYDPCTGAFDKRPKPFSSYRSPFGGPIVDTNGRSGRHGEQTVGVPNVFGNLINGTAEYFDGQEGRHAGTTNSFGGDWDMPVNTPNLSIGNTDSGSTSMLGTPQFSRLTQPLQQEVAGLPVIQDHVDAAHADPDRLGWVCFCRDFSGEHDVLCPYASVDFNQGY